MAIQTTTNINVDFYDKKYILINAKQLDRNSRFLSVSCYNQGEPYQLYAGEHSAYIRYKKSDNQSVFNFCEINNKGKIIVELTEQMLASDGICYADLVIVNKGHADVNPDTGEIVAIDNTSILSTMTFCIDVSEMVVLNSDIESSYEFDGLNTALEKAEAEYTEVMKTSKSWAVGGTGIRDGENIDNSKYYAQQSSNSAGAANTSKLEAAESERLAEEHMADALTYSQNAQTYMGNAETYMENAKASALEADTSAANAEESAASSASSATSASTSANLAKNDMNSAANSASSASTSAENAHNYYLQTEAIVNGLNGAFLPKGTVTFAELIELKESGAVAAGYLYHISDNFVTDENFRVSGKECGAGTSVYYTVDDQFDYFVGTTVAGIKGENEAEYRTGMVELTAENVGAIPSEDIATIDEIKIYLGIEVI